MDIFIFVVQNSVFSGLIPINNISNGPILFSLKKCNVQPGNSIYTKGQVSHCVANQPHEQKDNFLSVAQHQHLIHPVYF